MQIRRGVVAVAAAMTMLVGCTGNPGQGAGSASGEPSASASKTASATPTPTPEPTPPQVAQARALATQYDYDAALALLAGLTHPDAVQAASEISAAKASAVVWPDNGTVPHIFYHSLIVDPARAFAPNEPTRQGYADYMVTEKEFRAQIEQIYARGWVLVLPERLATKGADGAMTYTPISLPPGKKPFVLSVDDVSYYEYMAKSGFANKLILTPDGKTTNLYTDAAGVTTQGAHDVTTVLDEFVRAHPDFAYHGDKGLIALTGYEGILGYRTSVREYGDNDVTKAEQAEATKVAASLKADGWRFASHSWGHMSVYKDSIGRLQWDTQMWDAEVRPLLGQVDSYIFPFGTDGYGSKVFASPSDKYQVLLKDGFTYFFPIDSTQLSWTQLTPAGWRQMRIAIDGTSMGWALKDPKSPLHEFFDVASTRDPARP